MVLIVDRSGGPSQQTWFIYGISQWVVSLISGPKGAMSFTGPSTLGLGFFPSIGAVSVSSNLILDEQKPPLDVSSRPHRLLGPAFATINDDSFGSIVETSSIGSGFAVGLDGLVLGKSG